MKQIEAIFFLAWQLMALLVERAIASVRGDKKGKELFLDQLRESEGESLLPFTVEQRQAAYTVSACTFCQRCTYFRNKHTDHVQAYQSIQRSQRMALHRDVGHDVYASEVDSHELAKICPAGISMHEIHKAAGKEKEVVD